MDLSHWGQSRDAEGRHRAARPGLGTWVGAQVASPRCPILRPGTLQCIGDHGHRAMPGLDQPLARRGRRSRLELRARITRRFQDPRHEQNGRRGVGLACRSIE
jgi:hypothetical protein